MNHILFLQIVLVIVILVKRQILRMLLLSKRGPHSPVGFDTPKVNIIFTVLFYHFTMKTSCGKTSVLL